MLGLARGMPGVTGGMPGVTGGVGRTRGVAGVVGRADGPGVDVSGGVAAVAGVVPFGEEVEVTPCGPPAAGPTGAGVVDPCGGVLGAPLDPPADEFGTVADERVLVAGGAEPGPPDATWADRVLVGTTLPPVRPLPAGAGPPAKKVTSATTVSAAPATANAWNAFAAPEARLPAA